MPPPPAPPIPAPPIPEPPAPEAPLPLPFIPSAGPLLGGLLAAAQALGGLWNWFWPKPKPEDYLPRGKKAWYVTTDFTICQDFLGNTGKCILWDKGGNMETQYIPAASGDTAAYVIGDNDFNVYIGVRQYNYETEEYGDEVTTQTVESIGSAGAKYITRGTTPQIYYRLLPPNEPPGEPTYPYPPEGPDPENPPWLPQFDPDPKPNPFPPELPPAPEPPPYPQPAPAPEPEPNPRPPTPAPTPGPGKLPAPVPAPAPAPKPTPSPAPGPAPQPAKDPEPMQVPELPKLAPLIDLLGQLVKREEDEIEQTEAETLVLEGVKILSQRTRTDIVSIAIELGKLEAKMEKTLERQAPKSLLEELANELLDKLAEIADSINNGEGGNGEGGPCELPKMGPFARRVVAPADRTANGDPLTYDVNIGEQKGDAYLEAMLAALFDHITILKGWRNYMAPKPNQGQPVTVIWEEIEE